VTGWERRYPAPAKLNLFLHVVGRRADGYHLLQSVFRLIDLGDTLRFAPRTDGRIARAAPLAGVPEERDLCLRAARLLQEASGCALGVEITLDKRLPMGGGLGGGSSDAATVLLALNRLWRLDWPRERLQALGLQLGADVPFFIYGRNAFVEGVGERLQALESAAGLVPRRRAARQRADGRNLRRAGFDTGYESHQNGGLFSGLGRGRPVRPERSRSRRVRTLPGGGAGAGLVEAARRSAHDRLRSLCFRSLCRRAGRARRAGADAGGLGESPSWLRHRILIPACEGSNPSSPAKFRMRAGESPARIVCESGIAPTRRAWPTTA
jgi:hypothetical protein